jgi:ankyrin repeat protein
VKGFIDNGADVNAKSNDGDTALIFASQNHHKEVRELLIKAGAK